MRTFDLNATVAEVTAYDDLEGSVVSAGDLPGDIDVDVLSDASLEVAVQPRTSTPQVPDMELWIGGTRVERVDIEGDLTVERDYDNVAQGWSFSSPLRDANGVFGTPFLCIGPPMGRDEVDILGVYDTPTGLKTVKLITGGIVDNSSREAGDQGIIESFTGLDRAGRFDGVKVTKQFPPGHGLHRGRVGREIMRSAGETQTNFEDGATMQKEIQLVDGEPIPTLAEIFEVENRKLLWSDDGFATNPQVGRIRSDESPVFSFEERDLLRISTVKLDSVANVITLVIANGTRQKTIEDCGLVYSVETEYQYAAPYTMKRCAYRQNVDGSYTTLTPHAPLDGPVLIRKIETKRGYRCETLVHEIVKVWEMNRRETPRHWWKDTGTLADPTDDEWVAILCYTDDNDGVAGGPAYMDETEVFRLVSVSQTKHFYLHTDYIHDGSLLGTGDQWDRKLFLIPAAAYATPAYVAANAGATALRTYGQAQGSVTFLSKMGHLEGAVKPRDTSFYPYAPWNETPPDFDQMIWGNGTGVNNTNSDLSISEQNFLRSDGVGAAVQEYDDLIPWSISATVFYGDSENFMYREDSYQWEWAAKKGAEFYYTENDIRGEESKSLRLTSAVVKKYIASKPTHSEETTTTDVISGEVKVVRRDGLSGHLPGIERLDQVEPNDNLYEDGEQEELNKNARRSDTEQVTVTVPFDFFLACHLPREVTVEFPWAENEDELRKMAEMLAQESAAMPVFFTLPANFLIRETMPIHLLYRPFAVDHDIRVKKVRWKRSPQQPILTEVEARLYGW